MRTHRDSGEQSPSAAQLWWHVPASQISRAPHSESSWQPEVHWKVDDGTARPPARTVICEQKPCGGQSAFVRQPESHVPLSQTRPSRQSASIAHSGAIPHVFGPSSLASQDSPGSQSRSYRQPGLHSNSTVQTLPALQSPSALHSMAVHVPSLQTAFITQSRSVLHLFSSSSRLHAQPLAMAALTNTQHTARRNLPAEPTRATEQEADQLAHIPHSGCDHDAVNCRMTASYGDGRDISIREADSRRK